MGRLFDLIGHHLPELETRWAELSVNPRHVNEWTPRQRTECEALAELVPLLRREQQEEMG